MGLKELLFGIISTKEVKPPDISEHISLREVPAKGGRSGNVQISAGNIKQFQVKRGGLVGEGDDEAQPSEYDLEQIKEAVDTDSYISIAIHKYAQLVFKAGYSIVSDNESAAEYIRTRMRMMSFTTGTPTDILLQGIAEDLILYSNAFLVKSRVDANQLGGIQAQGVYDTKPVGGYFRVAPSSVSIKRDKNGSIKSYEQSLGSNETKFKPLDVIHFYVDKDAGAAFGTPRLTPVLEDVKMLRKLEGHSLSQVYRYANPLYQVKVGIPKEGMMATDVEISDARKEFDKINNDGIIITNERTEILAIGAEGEALDITRYLDYFEKRVFSALNVSASMMGRGGAKQDAETMEEQQHNTVKFFQRQIATFIQEEMFREMLLEGGFDPLNNEQDIVQFKFDEISLETRIKKETHALNMFQGNLIAFEEARRKIGKDSDNIDEGRLYMNMIQLPHDLAVAQTKDVSTTGTSDKSIGSQNKTSSIISPSNQHGTSSVKVKESSEDRISTKTRRNVEDYREKYPDAYKKFLSARNDVSDHEEDASIILPVARDSIAKYFKNIAGVQINLGVERAYKDTQIPKNVVKNVPFRLIDDQIDRVTKKVFKDIKRKLSEIGKNATKEEKRAVFDVVEYRIRFLAEHIIPKAYWYGYVKTCQYLKVPEVYVHFGNSLDQEEHEAVINTNRFSLDDIPAYHAYCSCKIALYKETKEGG